MRRYNSGFAVILLFALVLSSCSQELSVTTAPDTEGTPVRFALGVALFNATAGSSVVATRSTDHSTVDEAAVSNVRTLQFSSDGSSLLSNVYTSPVDTTNLIVSLHPAINSHIYFVANAGNDDSNDLLKSFSGTETTFKTLTKTLTQGSDLLYTTSASRINLPMISGCQVVTIPSYTLVDKRSTPVSLTRTVACLVINYSVTVSNFVVRHVRVCNMPATMEYCAPSAAAGVTATYPATLTSATVFNTGYTDVTNQNLNNVSGASQSGTLYYYVPENQRGQITTTNERQKAGIPSDYATYVELLGYTLVSTDGKGEFCYRIYPGGNMTSDYNIVRNTQYAMNANIKGFSPSDQRINERKLANCYILTPGQSIYIPIKQANQSTDLGTQISNVTSSTLTPSVVWQTAAGLVTATMDNTVGCIKVTASSTAATSGTVGGNALVAVKNGTTTLWSWHIWVTGYDPTVTGSNQTYNNGTISPTFMDRNLGALNNSVNDINAFGMFYQWGRKDPFPGASAVASGTTTDITLYDGSGNQLASNYITKKATATGASGMIQTSVQNPVVFYGGNSNNSYDWYSSTGGTRNDNLWGSAKTVYDPCPAGWKIPTNGPGSASPWYNLGESPDSDGNILAANGYSSFYPSSGMRYCSDGSLVVVGTQGRYWSSSPSGNFAYYMYESGSSVQPSTNFYRGSGFSVRCVKE